MSVEVEKFKKAGECGKYGESGKTGEITTRFSFSDVTFQRCRACHEVLQSKYFMVPGPAP